MEILYVAIAIYLTIGVILNFNGPLSRKIWVTQIDVLARNDVNKTKFFLFTCTIRLGVTMFYPIFIFSH